MPLLSPSSRERKCAVYGCENTLSSDVPLRIQNCGYHQFIELQIEQELKNQGKNCKFSPEDRKFLYSHCLVPGGSHIRFPQVYCYASDLYCYLGIPQPTFHGYITTQKIKAKKDKDNDRYLILLEDAVKIIGIFRGWISAAKAAELIKADRGVLRQYALEGEFGPFRKDLSGTVLISESILPRLQQLFDSAKKQRRKFANRPGRFLQNGEIDAKTIAMQIGVPRRTVWRWIRSGQLKGEKRGGWFIVKERDFNEFCETNNF